MDVWVFGYGSLIWRPDFPFREARPARVHGWVRRFWQGSHDHRGLPHAPGRVVTLVPEPDGICDGMAYRIAREVVVETFERLDHREKNGYERHPVQLVFRDGPDSDGIVYIAPRDNHAFLGPAPLGAMVAQIRACAGPSGTNLDYLLRLAASLREMQADDPHVFELERAVTEATG
ncbi:MAG: gamma-glutamylcyclotransferase [Ectothiorhodospiraceae bacterium]|nr:gamma-glutamylcyclotransferase [Chromatiales bacterium]MCP5154204.1 gamma-glutamylcyclotransferase [Ectothiorhodospiraceae bacterium]